MVIAKFRSPRHRDAMLTAKLNKSNPKEKLSTQHLGMAGPSKPVFVSEHLSPAIKSLHAAALLKAKKEHFKFVWLFFLILALVCSTFGAHAWGPKYPRYRRSVEGPPGISQEGQNALLFIILAMVVTSSFGIRVAVSRTILDQWRSAAHLGSIRKERVIRVYVICPLFALQTV
ncbi:unnamed protein product, partial [Iphiclides podalirius]